MEFLFPFPEAAGGADRGYVKGFVDLLFEHEGRVYFGDWKTDRLPSWDEAVVEAHVAKNYALQEQLYALALVRMLGIASEADYEARFGGTLYLFVRGLPARAPSAAAARPSPSSPPGARRSPGDSARRRRRERARATLASRPGQRRWPAATSTGRRSIWRSRPPAGRATLPAAERRAFALLVLASCEARAEGATRLALQAGAGSGLDARLERLGAAEADRAAVADLVGRLASHPALEPLVGRPGDHRPFILDGGCLYQERDLRLEERLADALAARIATPVAAAGRRRRPRWRRPLPRTVAGRPRRAPPSQPRSRDR